MTDDPKPSEGEFKEALPILVVEDSRMNMQLAIRQLERLGHKPVTATNGLEALEKLEEHPVKIILMDCQMPEMDGFEATWQIRHKESERSARTGQVQRVYIIAMTADSADDSREKCLAAGMNDYIRKPVQVPELAAALERAGRAPNLEHKDEVLDPIILAGLRLLAQPGEEDPLAELIRLFLTEAPDYLGKIEKAVSANDMWSMSKIVAAATSLKGSADNLGARKLAGLCGQMEQTTRAGMIDDVRPLLDQAREELERVTQALRRVDQGSAKA